MSKQISEMNLKYNSIESFKKKIDLSVKEILETLKFFDERLNENKSTIKIQDEAKADKHMIQNLKGKLNETNDKIEVLSKEIEKTSNNQDSMCQSLESKILVKINSNLDAINKINKESNLSIKKFSDELK
jgi:hypothetical protein